MKIGIQSRIAISVFLLACLVVCHSTTAQQVQFRVHQFNGLPDEPSAFIIHGINDNGIAFGYWNSTGDPAGRRGFFYVLSEDRTTGQYFDLATYLDLPSQWEVSPGVFINLERTICRRINNAGLGTAQVRFTNGQNKVIWFDMNASPPTWELMPEADVVGGSNYYNASDINELGDILIRFENEIGANELYVYNPLNSQVPAEYVTYDDGSPIEGDGRLTNSRKVVGDLDGQPEPPLFVWQSGQPVQLLGSDYENFVTDINSQGQFTGGGSIGSAWYYDPPTQQFQYLHGATDYGSSINDSGDIVGDTQDRSDIFYYRDGDCFLLKSLIVGEGSQFIQDAVELRCFSSNWGLLTNRDQTGYGMVVCAAEQVTTTGRGRNKTVVSERRYFILIPEILTPPGNSETYSSTDTPLAIPDNDQGGVASNISAGDHTIANLTVNVNISHPRPSDLNVYLIDPAGGPAIELFNFTGDNNVPNFNGTSSDGTWTLEVYDTRNRKTGTLNSWSIKVDY